MFDKIKEFLGDFFYYTKDIIIFIIASIFFYGIKISIALLCIKLLIWDFINTHLIHIYVK